MKKEDVSIIQAAIAQYTNGHQQLDDLQGKNLLPRGDQKIGVLGEFYAQLYLAAIHPKASMEIKLDCPYDIIVETKFKKCCGGSPF